MIRLVIFISSVIGLSFTPFAGAASSGSSGGGGSSGGSGIEGRIQSVTSTNFSVGIRSGHHHRRLRPVIVHFNPDTTNITINGQTVRNFDVKVTHMYASVVGTMKNDVLEATSITITSSKPSHPKRSKSKSST
jgi:hypothetical protein